MSSARLLPGKRHRFTERDFHRFQKTLLFLLRVLQLDREGRRTAKERHQRINQQGGDDEEYSDRLSIRAGIMGKTVGDRKDNRRYVLSVGRSSRKPSVSAVYSRSGRGRGAKGAV